MPTVNDKNLDLIPRMRALAYDLDKTGVTLAKNIAVGLRTDAARCEAKLEEEAQLAVQNLLKLMPVAGKPGISWLQVYTELVRIPRDAAELANEIAAQLTVRPANAKGTAVIVTRDERQINVDGRGYGAVNQKTTYASNNGARVDITRELWNPSIR